MIKMILRSEQRHRDTDGVIFDTCVGGAENKITETITALVNDYAGEIGKATHQQPKEFHEKVDALSWQEITQGGNVGGHQLSPVTFLLTQLAAHYAPFGEEQRITAMTELMSFII